MNFSRQFIFLSEWKAWFLELERERDTEEEASRLEHKYFGEINLLLMKFLRKKVSDELKFMGITDNGEYIDEVLVGFWEIVIVF